MDEIEVGTIVKINGLWLSQQDKWTRERWIGKEGVVMRFVGTTSAFADVRSGELNDELAVPVTELRRSPKNWRVS